MGLEENDYGLINLQLG